MNRWEREDLAEAYVQKEVRCSWMRTDQKEIRVQEWRSLTLFGSDGKAMLVTSL